MPSTASGQAQCNDAHPPSPTPARVCAQGDACALSADLRPFDAILAANLLCRLPEPMKFLDRAKDLVKPGGVLVLVSPYSWLPGWTPKEKWLGGFYDTVRRRMHACSCVCVCVRAVWGRGEQAPQQQGPRACALKGEGMRGGHGLHLLQRQHACGRMREAHAPHLEGRL